MHIISAQSTLICIFTVPNRENWFVTRNFATPELFLFYKAILTPPALMTIPAQTITTPVVFPTSNYIHHVFEYRNLWVNAHVLACQRVLLRL